MAVPNRRGTMSLDRYRRIAIIAFISLCVIVITGAAVRLTGSGLGCSDWPTCEEDQLIADLEYHAMIEFVNRLITGVVSIAVIVAVLASRRLIPARPDLTRWAWGLVAGVLAQIVLGGIVVLAHLDPVAVIGHFLLSMVLIWNAVVLVWRAGEQAPGAVVDQRAVWGVSVLSVAVLVTGTIVTGSGPHSGGGSEVVDRLPFFVPDVARVHGATVMALLALVIWVNWRFRTGRLLLGVLMAQGAIGYTQYFTGVPVVLVGMHVVGAVSLWVTVIMFHLRARVDGPAAGEHRAERAPDGLRGAVST